MYTHYDQIPPQDRIHDEPDGGLRLLYTDYHREFESIKRSEDGGFFEAANQASSSLNEKYEILIRNYKLSKYKQDRPITKEQKDYEQGKIDGAKMSNKDKIRDDILNKTQKEPTKELWVNTPLGTGYVLYATHISPHHNDIFTVALQVSGKIKHFDSGQLTVQINHTLELNLQNNKPEFPSDKLAE